MSGNKVRVFGPGIEAKDNVVGEPASFTVDTANAGKGKLDVTVSDPKGKSVKVRFSLIYFTMLFFFPIHFFRLFFLKASCYCWHFNIFKMSLKSL